VVAGAQEYANGGKSAETTAKVRRRVRACVTILVKIARDAYRVDAVFACECESTLERRAQLSAALRSERRIASAESHLKMDVSDVQDAVLQGVPFMRSDRAARDVLRAG